MISSARVSLAKWRGAGGRTLIQGAKIAGSMMIIGQADDVAGRKLQTVRLRAHNAGLDHDPEFVCSVTDGGHGSTFGTELVDGQIWIWLGHAVHGVVRFKLVDGEAKCQKVPRLPRGDVSVDQAHDLLSVRAGTRYRGYLLSSVKAGRPVLLFDVRVRDWGKRFQGHYLTRGSLGNLLLCVHRDMATKAASRLDLFRIQGGKITATIDQIDTTGWGDEAEGITDWQGYLWGSKRTGGAGPGRTLDLRRTKYATRQKVDPAAVGTWKVINVSQGSWLWGRPVDPKILQKDWPRREAGYPITTGVAFKTINGVRHLQTRAGFLYSTRYLQKLS